MPVINFLAATYRVEPRGDQWFMVVEELGQKVSYPAASQLGAELMISLEKKRRAGCGAVLS